MRIFSLPDDEDDEGTSDFGDNKGSSYSDGEDSGEGGDYVKEEAMEDFDGSLLTEGRSEEHAIVISSSPLLRRHPLNVVPFAGCISIGKLRGLMRLRRADCLARPSLFVRTFVATTQLLSCRRSAQMRIRKCPDVSSFPSFLALNCVLCFRLFQD